MLGVVPWVSIDIIPGRDGAVWHVSHFLLLRCCCCCCCCCVAPLLILFDSQVSSARKDKVRCDASRSFASNIARKTLLGISSLTPKDDLRSRIRADSESSVSRREEEGVVCAREEVGEAGLERGGGSSLSLL